MGEAADDAFDAAMRHENDLRIFWQYVHEECEASAPKPCHLVAIDDANDSDDVADVRCTVCGKTFCTEV